LPPQETFANLDAIIEKIRGARIHVILAGMLAPRNLGEHYTAEFDRIYPELAQKHKVGFYPFFLDGVALDPALNQPDGIHPNASGVALIVNRILPLVKSVLNAIPK
jgi:acyl-CoA thioesterase-1